MRIAVPLLALLLVVGCQKKSTPVKGDPTLAMHRIVLEAEVTGSGDSCTANAIGPHALLTAAHCVIGTSAVKVDGVEYAVDRILYDERDHAIILVQGPVFENLVGVEQRFPHPNEHVMFVGNPGKARSVRREGFFLKPSFVDDITPILLFQLPVFPGDSGGGVLSDDGHLIGVISIGDRSAEAGVFPLAFTPEQLAQASK